MLDWLWWFWSPWSVFLYVNGALWVIRAFADEPIYIGHRHCKWCEAGIVLFWPLAMPIGILGMFINWLRIKVGRNRTYV
jgi:hypothetical protein